MQSKKISNDQELIQSDPKNVLVTFAFKGSNLVSFSQKTKLKNRLPFSENLKLKIGRFRKIAIGSKLWTCMLYIRLFDKVNYG